MKVYITIDEQAVEGLEYKFYNHLTKCIHESLDKLEHRMDSSCYGHATITDVEIK